MTDSHLVGICLVTIMMNTIINDDNYDAEKDQRPDKCYDFLIKIYPFQYYYMKKDKPTGYFFTPPSG